MARSSAERVRLHRERKRKALQTAADQTASYLRSSFSEFVGSFPDFLDGRTLLFDETLDSLGIRIDGTSLHEEVQSFRSDGLGHVTMSSLERASGLVGAFLDAASELSELINRFKLQEIETRIAEIEGSDLSDPTSRKKALADVIVLNRLRERLHREIRYSFRPIQVKDP